MLTGILQLMMHALNLHGFIPLICNVLDDTNYEKLEPIFIKLSNNTTDNKNALTTTVNNLTLAHTKEFK